MTAPSISSLDASKYSSMYLTRNRSVVVTVTAFAWRSFSAGLRLLFANIRLSFDFLGSSLRRDRVSPIQLQSPLILLKQIGRLCLLCSSIWGTTKGNRSHILGGAPCATLTFASFGRSESKIDSVPTWIGNLRMTH